MYGLFDCFGWVRWSSRIDGMRKYSSQWAMESIKVMEISTMDRGASQGKSNTVNGFSTFMGNEMDIKFVNKIREKGNQESFIMYFFNKKKLKNH